MLGKTPFLTGTPIGHFKLATSTGLTTALGAGSPVFEARFNSAIPNLRALLLYLRITAQTITPFTGAQEIGLLAKIGRIWTSGPTGGTLLTPLTATQQSMNSLGDSTSILEARVSAAGALGTGTVTLDPNPFMQGVSAQLLAAAAAQQNQLQLEWSAGSDFRYPINFRADSGFQEGFAVQATPAQGAGGTVRYTVEMEWVEYIGNVGTLV